jgi:hypothetical protein
VYAVVIDFNLFPNVMPLRLNSVSMASSSINVSDEINIHYDSKQDVQEVIIDCNIPECKGVFCHIWMTKCVSCTMIAE